MNMQEDKSIIEVSHVSKYFGEKTALDDVTLNVKKGEFVTILGPSGCGKTTLLRLIAGFQTASEGEIRISGMEITQTPPHKRPVNTVFQKYALFPHLNVYDNIAFGLKLKKTPKAEIKKRVSEMLDLVQLPGFEKRKPSELSGGQRQRVAIARSLVNNPKVLLLDEPLGALDLQLRRAMQLELKRLQKKLGITFIYITHDQEEAINMSDRIAVMNKGTFEQIGTPDEIYNHPKTSYVATFVGNANILKGTAQETEADILKVSLAGSIVSAVAEGKKIAPGTPVTLAVRSENMIFDETCQSGMEAVVVEKSFAGGLLRVVLKLADGTEVIANRHGIDAGVQPGQKVTCHFDAENAVLVDLPSETESGAAV